MEKKLVTSSLSYAINEKYLINNVSLSFESGYLYGILGPNGSGKSSLLKIISGIWKPLCGTVTWNGDPLLNKERQILSRIISLVPQNPLPAFDFLVQDIVAMGRYPYNTKYWDSADEVLIYQALHAVDAWHLRERSVNHLSYGERQRVYIARALVTESPILLLDEPTSSLDIQHQLEIWELLQKFVRNGKIVIVTTHDLTLAERFCDRIAVLNQGRCIGMGTFNSLMSPFLLKEVFGIKEATSADASAVFKQYILS